jgi:putative FmdB family regulatory protein
MRGFPRHLRVVMPIYAYKCESCGHQQDVLQKMSDPVLSTCPACGKESFAKQLTAAGFQLKGSGWYATDFRNKGSTAAGSEAKADVKGDAKTDTTAAPAAASPASPAPVGPSPSPSV